MCKFCKTEPGDIATIRECQTVRKVGRTVVGTDNLSVGWWRSDNDEAPATYITAEYYMTNKHPSTYVDLAHVEIPIKFCPFCGRKLHNN